MYGTSTPNSDVDVKGIFISDREVEAHRKGGAAKVPVEAEAPVSLIVRPRVCCCCCCCRPCCADRFTCCVVDDVLGVHALEAPRALEKRLCVGRGYSREGGGKMFCGRCLHT